MIHAPLRAADRRSAQWFDPDDANRGDMAMSREEKKGNDNGRQTTYGRPLKAVYGPEDIAGLDHARDLGLPGQYPYTRGVRPFGYRDREWTRRQVVGLGTSEETNERLRYLFGQGQTGFSVCGMGYAPYESGDPRSLGILGRGGVWIDTLRDMQTLFEGIDLEAVTINQIGASMPVFAMILAEADRRGIPYSRLRGTIQNVVMPGGEGDDLRGNHCIDVIEFCARHMPHWNHTSISARNMRDQGLSSVQEVAFGIYQGALTVRAALARGLEVDAFAPRITFFFSAENELLEEIAKYRAARRLWARPAAGRGREAAPGRRLSRPRQYRAADDRGGEVVLEHRRDHGAAGGRRRMGTASPSPWLLRRATLLSGPCRRAGFAFSWSPIPPGIRRATTWWRARLEKQASR